MRLQEAQYIPGPWLKEGKNELIFLEVEKSPAAATGLSPRPVGAQMPANLSSWLLTSAWSIMGAPVSVANSAMLTPSQSSRCIFCHFAHEQVQTMVRLMH